MMKTLLGAVVLAWALTGCGGPLEEEEGTDAVSQRQGVMTPADLLHADGDDDKPKLKKEQDLIRQFNRPEPQDRLLYHVSLDGHCTGGR